MPDAYPPGREIPLAVPSLGPRELAAVTEAIRSGWVSTAAPDVGRFEEAFAARLGAPAAAAVVSGTAALHLALLVAGVGPGDEVLLPALTFVAPANAVRHAGAHPVFVDVDPATAQLDARAALAFLRDRCDAAPGGGLVNRRSGRRVAALAYRLALACDLPQPHAALVRVAALLQDIGTLGVPIHILSKPDILTIEEMSSVQLHPTYARDILADVPGLAAVAWWVGCHHERVDGKGYPAMLEGVDVPIEAQILGISEAFNAMTSDRPYRKAIAPSDAIEVLRGLGGARFSPELVARFEEAAAPLALQLRDANL